jgi:hypothetical protein
MMGISTPLLSFTLRAEDAIVVNCVKSYLNTLTAGGGGENSGRVGYCMEVAAL